MISVDKTYRTRDGRAVRIYAVDGSGSWEVHAAFKTANGWVSGSWTEKGNAYQPVVPGQESDLDLVEVKPRIKRTVWINLFPHTTTMFSHKLDADVYASSARLACVKVEIDCEEGEGL